jgi:TolB-like protein
MSLNSARLYHLSRSAIVIVSLLCYLFAAQCATVPVKPYEVTNTFRSSRIEQRDIRRIAILPLENPFDDRVAGPLIAEELNLQLGKLGAFELIERSRISELMREQDLDTLTRFDATTAAKIGKLLGVQAVVMGSVTKFRRHPSDKQDTVYVVQREHHRSLWDDEWRYHDYHRHHGHHGGYEPGNRPGEHRERENDAAEALAVLAACLLIVTIVGIIWYATRPQPTAEVGANLRLVDVETGEVLWQADDVFAGRKPRIQALVEEREDKARLVTDIEFLTQVFCQEMAKTLLSR